ncbi:DUF4230 domain-containing protein [Bacillus sp. Y1]|nr:DUF4230 domain-containing protein [Bacillus sp. Y1]
MRKSHAILTAGALAVGLYVGVSHDQSQAPQRTAPVAPIAKANVITIDEQAIISALNTRSQIVGLTGNVSKSVTVSDDAWYGDKTIELAATGTFKLGVQTNDIEITTKGNTVTVRFPHPKVISVDMPFDQATISKDVGMLRKELTDAELQSLYGKAREGAIDDIKRNRQAFDKAEDSVERTIERLIAPVPGVEDVEFIEMEAE